MFSKYYFILIFECSNILKMARVIFFLQSENSPANIYIRFSIENKKVLKRRTGFSIDTNNWKNSSVKKRSNQKEEAYSEKKVKGIYKPGFPTQKTDETKSLKSKLDKLANFINDAYNEGVSKGVEFTGEWLQEQIDIFNNKKPIVELDLLVNYIQKYIDDAPTKRNQKEGTGLSNGRIRNLNLFKNTISRYQTEALSGKKILIKDINIQFVDNYKKWLFNQNYSINYIGKNIANIKTICFDAFKNDIETSPQLKNIKVISESKKPEQIIILTEEEQEQIKNAILIRESLVNARKWLLLGCLIGQRGGDLLNITESNIKEINGIKIIEIKQQKTGKLVAIPLLPEALEIVESGLPHKISLPRFNEYIKDVCEAAGINELITSKIKVTGRNPLKIETLPKYKFITSHVCRRSFATNFYARIPTPILMNITAHGSESMFLSYIGKTTYDNAFQMVEYFSKLKPRDKEPVMEVIREAN